MAISPPKHTKPSSITIEPARQDFEFNNVPRYWFSKDPVLTHFLNALSLTFPDGERFFVDSVRAFRDRVQDPARQQEISGFIGQEAMHSLEHVTFNKLLENSGYAQEAQSGQTFARDLLALARKRLPKRAQLAATAGLEHITAILAKRLLEDQPLLEQIDPEVRNLWLWHAIEETEHKAVAFDLLQDIDPSYLLRVQTFLSSTLFLAGYCSRYTWQFLKRDKLHRKPWTLAKGTWRLLGPGGFLLPLVPEYLSYLKPGFHPWQTDDSHLVHQWRQYLAAEAPAAA